MRWYYMNDRLSGYLRAIETSKTEKFHDYYDVHKRKMPQKDYVTKWGRYTGSITRLKHD